MSTKKYQLLGEILKINDDSISTEETWSSSKIQSSIDDELDDRISDGSVSYEKTWSSKKIQNAIEEGSGFKIEKVASTDNITKEKVIYLVPNNNSGDDIYDEYMLIDGVPELISSYINELTEEEIEEILGEALDDGTGSVPIATRNTIGCIAVGDGLIVTEEGVVSFDHDNALGDHIVERGIYTVSSDNIWYWTKYNSGLLTIINIVKNLSIYIGTAYGSMYYSTFTRTIHNSVPILAGSLEYGVYEYFGGNGLMYGNANAIDKASNTVTFYACNPTSQSSITKNAVFYYKASWK